jgi:hypothetical protein
MAYVLAFNKCKVHYMQHAIYIKRKQYLPMVHTQLAHISISGSCAVQALSGTQLRTCGVHLIRRCLTLYMS